MRMRIRERLVSAVSIGGEDEETITADEFAARETSRVRYAMNSQGHLQSIGEGLYRTSFVSRSGLTIVDEDASYRVAARLKQMRTCG